MAFWEGFIPTMLRGKPFVYVVSQSGAIPIGPDGCLTAVQVRIGLANSPQPRC